MSLKECLGLVQVFNLFSNILEFYSKIIFKKILISVISLCLFEMKCEKKHKNYTLQDMRDGLSWPLVSVGCTVETKILKANFFSVIDKLLKLSSLSFFVSPLKRE